MLLSSSSIVLSPNAIDRDIFIGLVSYYLLSANLFNLTLLTRKGIEFHMQTFPITVANLVCVIHFGEAVLTN